MPRLSSCSIDQAGAFGPGGPDHLTGLFTGELGSNR